VGQSKCADTADLCLRPLKIKRLGPPLHHVLLDGPHPQSLAIHVQGNGEEKASNLNRAKGNKRCPRTVALEPVVEEQRKNETMEHVCSQN
jgi:hypothetical protein